MNNLRDMGDKIMHRGLWLTVLPLLITEDSSYSIWRWLGVVVTPPWFIVFGLIGFLIALYGGTIHILVDAWGELKALMDE